MHFLNFDTWHIKESDRTILRQPAAKAVCGIVAVPRLTQEKPDGWSVCPHCTTPNAERRALIEANTLSR